MTNEEIQQEIYRLNKEGANFINFDAGQSNFSQEDWIENFSEVQNRDLLGKKKKSLTSWGGNISHNNAAGVTVPISLFKGLWIFVEAPFGVFSFPSGNMTFTVGASVVTVHGNTSPYYVIDVRSATQPFKVQFARITTLTPAQLAVDWFLEQKGVFGGEHTNTVTPNEFQSPETFQNLKSDVRLNYILDSESGIQIDILPGENIQVTLFCDALVDLSNYLRAKGIVRTYGDGSYQGYDPENARKLVLDVGNRGNKTLAQLAAGR